MLFAAGERAYPLPRPKKARKILEVGKTHVLGNPPSVPQQPELSNAACLFVLIK